MKKGCVVVAVALCVVVSVTAAEENTPPAPAEQVDMAEMMKRAKQFTAPGDHHQALERFLGTWDVETSILMGGESKPEKGTATVSWLMEGRWLKHEMSGTIMGMSVESFSIIGYDNFKMSYVGATVSSMDTALLTYEGDMDPSGKALISYGTLDEYLTGEHDKMVKYVWRFPSEDRMVLEVHDLPIGENNTKVVEVAYTRRKQ